MAENGSITKQDLADFKLEMLNRFDTLENRIKNNFYDILSRVNNDLDERYKAKLEATSIMSRIRDTKNLDTRVDSMEVEITELRQKVVRLEKGAN